MAFANLRQRSLLARHSPWLWFVAGPNGAGKSTFLLSFAASVEDIVGPDAIATEVLPGAPEKAALAAGRESIRRMRALIVARESFAVETTLSGKLHLKIASQATKQGWSLGIIYIGLGSSDLAIERVKQRMAKGGHDVPPADVRRRYERSLRNLAKIYSQADTLIVLDNSSVTMRRVLVARQGETVFRRHSLPKWLQSALRAVLPKRPRTSPRRPDSGATARR
jgi:predicted ABC-type ATPase